MLINECAQQRAPFYTKLAEYLNMAALGERLRKLSSHTNETDGPIISRQNPATPKKQPTDNDHSLVSRCSCLFQKYRVDPQIHDEK